MPLFRRLVEDPLGEVDEDGHVGATEWVTPIRVSREYNGRSTSLSKQDPQVPPDKTCASCRNRERAERANVQGVSFHDLHVTLSAKSRVPHTSADIGFVLSSPCAVSTCPFRLSMPASLAGDFIATKISLACKRDKMLTRQPSASVMLGLPRYSHASVGPLPASGIAFDRPQNLCPPRSLVWTYMSSRIYLARNEQRVWVCAFFVFPPVQPPSRGSLWPASRWPRPSPLHLSGRYHFSPLLPWLAVHLSPCTKPVEKIHCQHGLISLHLASSWRQLPG